MPLKNILKKVDENGCYGILNEQVKKNSNTSKYQFWQQNNHPIELWSTPVIKQKFDYIHNNPVAAGYVVHSWEWKYSSAKNYADLDAVMEVDDIGFLG